MVQFNMQIDPAFAATLLQIMRREHLPSKAEAIRFAVKRVQTAHQERDKNWWRRYLACCQRIPRKAGGKVMSQADFDALLF